MEFRGPNGPSQLTWRSATLKLTLARQQISIDDLLVIWEPTLIPVAYLVVLLTFVTVFCLCVAEPSAFTSAMNIFDWRQEASYAS